MNTRWLTASTVVSLLVLPTVLGACSGPEGATSATTTSSLLDEPIGSGSETETETAHPPTAPDLPTAQRELDTFLSEHDVSSTKTYCRVDIATPECRNFIRFKNKVSGRTAPGFMTTFTAPFRQAGGVEFFFPAGPRHTYKHFGDKIVDGKVIVEESTIEKVLQQGNRVTIKDLKLGAIVADLSFSDEESVLDGTRPDPADPTHTIPVRIVYTRFAPTTP